MSEEKKYHDDWKSVKNDDPMDWKHRPSDNPDPIRAAAEEIIKAPLKDYDQHLFFVESILCRVRDAERERCLEEMEKQSCNTLTWRNKWYALQDAIRQGGD